MVRKLTSEEASVYHPRTWYLKHHGVQKPYKPGQWRPVMDASAEYLGTSLNKCLLQGPNPINEMVDVLLLFRLRRVTGEIRAFFHRVKVPPED